MDSGLRRNDEQDQSFLGSLCRPATAVNGYDSLAWRALRSWAGIPLAQPVAAARTCFE